MVEMESREDVNLAVAHLPGMGKALAGNARRVGAVASSILAEHRDRGDSRIGVERYNAVDWVVVLDDTRGKGHALGIEFGTKNSFKQKGNLVGVSTDAVAPLRKATGLL